jgi:hypothetical protein
MPFPSCRSSRVFLAVALLCLELPLLAAEALRPPSVPLVACDPYFSIWSPADRLTDADTTHWTGKPHRLTSQVRIDGRPFRVLGREPAGVPALPQTGLEVLPTRTVYSFAGAGVTLTLTFMTAALPEDIDLLSRPVTYVTYTCQANDGKSHEVALQFDASGEIAVNEPQQAVVGTSGRVQQLTTLRLGSQDQLVLARKGDDVRIDWGYLYLAADSAAAQGAIVQGGASREAFAQSGAAPAAAGSVGPVAADVAVASLTFAPFAVPAALVSRMLILAYDDEYSIQYMRKNLRPYWRRHGWEAADLLAAAAREYPALQKRCAAFDAELMSDLTRAGGEPYARIAALAYRQCLAAGKFVADANGQPLQFCKENHSNGCIATSDVFYPMAPQFLLFGPSLAKSFLVPFMNYAASERWKFPFAPHDLGTYPHANGQVYGDGERGLKNQMPVEESGNLLILMAAVAQMEGNTKFADKYWPQLSQWAAYLEEKGFDPENQLCTDDFAGHLAHNVNLSAKAICGLGAFANLCAMRGDSARAQALFGRAREFAQRWVREADDGDHYRLAFDRPGTWSQKYNLIWDRILGLDLFPAEVLRKEMAYYRRIQNPYGVALDNRKDYTKLDWITWTATLTRNRDDFVALIAPVFKFLNETPDRSPMTDWYQTRTAKKVGFTARPVVGGVFAQMLYDQPTWQKYARRDTTHAEGWAVMPKPPTLRTIVAAADDAPATWRYTTTEPAATWFTPEFDASSWAEGRAGFGTSQTPGAQVGTPWRTADIWLRREVTLSAAQLANLVGWLHHDDDVEVYLNGALVVRLSGFTRSYDLVPLLGRGGPAAHAGRNTIAIHCHQRAGGQYIDFGLKAADAN